MTRTFLVALSVESTLDLDSIAAELQDELTQSGFEVESVKPWASTAPGALEVPPAIHPLIPNPFPIEPQS